MHEHIPMRDECSGHLVDLNFTFDHNFLIRRFQRALRRDLIEDSFFFKAAFDLKPLASFIGSSVVFHVICFSQNMSRSMHVSLPIICLCCSISLKDFTQRMLKQRQHETKSGKERSANKNVCFALPHAKSFVNILRGHKFNSRALPCLLWEKKPSLERNVDSEKLKR